jgi:hypothetical protein
LSLGTRSFAELANNTNRPSALIHGATELPLPPEDNDTVGFWTERSWSGAAINGTDSTKTIRRNTHHKSGVIRRADNVRVVKRSLLLVERR